VAGGAATGTGAVRYTVAANPDPQPRTGMLTVAGLPFTVTQAAAGCAVTASVPSTTLDSAGGSFDLSVSAPAACAWTVSAAPDWLSLPAMRSGTGNGSIRVTASANTALTPRTGSLAASGAVVEVVQRQGNTPPPTAFFGDVPLTHPYYEQITLLRNAAVTTGCTPTAYCPDATTTRGQMAVFIIRSVFGGDNFTFPQMPFFTDVPANHQFFKWIQKMRELGITSGCTASTYCPDDPVTRGQMAVFIVRGRLGIMAPQLPPGPAAPFFTDVPQSHPFFAFIQKMRELGITAGCTATEYCPDNPTTRGQMAVFLIRAFFTP
jgi:hypothetical protein